MKHRVLTIIGTIFISLLVVSVAFAYAITNVDGVWGTIDTDGASCDSWATGDGDSAATISNTNPAIQTPPNTDENQVRYGDEFSARYCSGPFATRSGFGFDGNNNVGTIAVNTPFYLGEFTHYNNPIYSNNSFDYVDLTVTASGIQCLNGGTPTEGSTLSLSYRFTLDETPNEIPCSYAGSTICPDRVTVSNNPLAAKFTCPEGVYTVQVLGFADSPNNQNNGCVGSAYPGSPSANFITEEGQDNYACLWAQITDYVPTAVDISSFTANSLTNSILVAWETVSETDVAGFNLYRTTNPDGSTDRIQLNTSLIDAAYLDDGGEYTFIDDGADFGVTYYYTVEVIYFEGQPEWLEPVSATLLHKVFLPMAGK